MKVTRKWLKELVFGFAGILYCVVAICCNRDLEYHFPERYTELVANIQTYENSEDKDMLTRINLYNEAKHVNATITKNRERSQSAFYGILYSEEIGDYKLLELDNIDFD